MINIFVDVIFFSEFIDKVQQLFVFTVTFDQFNAFLLNKIISFLASYALLHTKY